MQANFGSRRELVIAGRRVGELLAAGNPMEETDWLAPPGAGSCITIVATDAPLLPGQCKALARRVNALAAAKTMTGRDGHRSPGFPTGRLPELLS